LSPRPAAQDPEDSGALARWRLPLYGAHLLASPAIAASNVLLGLCVLALPATGLRGRLRIPAPARPAAWAAAAYLAALLVAVAASLDPAASAGALSEIFSFATFFLALLWVRGERATRTLVDGAILVGAVLALYGFAQLAAGWGDIDRRIRGPFSHYMTYSGWLLLVDLLLAARLLVRRAPAGGAPGFATAWLDRPAVAWGALAAITAALVASLTRSAWLALVVALVLCLALVRPRRLWVVPVVLGLFLVLAPVPVVQRALSIADPADESNYDRICMAEAGLRMIAERPLAGIGPDQVKHRYPIYRHPSAPRRTTPHLHDAYLQVAAERGLPALAALLALLALPARQAWRGLRAARQAGGPADLHLGVLGALAAFAVAALFENNWGDTEVQRLVLFLLAVPSTLAEPGGEEAR
jgi:O-antigen ligase